MSTKGGGWGRAARPACTIWDGGCHGASWGTQPSIIALEAGPFASGLCKTLPAVKNKLSLRTRPDSQGCPGEHPPLCAGSTAVHGVERAHASWRADMESHLCGSQSSSFIVTRRGLTWIRFKPPPFIRVYGSKTLPIYFISNSWFWEGATKGWRNRRRQLQFPSLLPSSQRASRTNSRKNCNAHPRTWAWLPPATNQPRGLKTYCEVSKPVHENDHVHAETSQKRYRDMGGANILL